MTDTKTLEIISPVSAIFTGILGPLIIYLIAETKTDNLKHTLNFVISAIIYWVVYFIIAVVGSIVTLGFGAIIFGPLGALLGLGMLVLLIIGAVKASKGETYKYPLEIQFIK